MQSAAQNIKTDYLGFFTGCTRKRVWGRGYRLGDLILCKGCRGVRDWQTQFGIAVFVLFAQFSRYVETEWRSEYWLHVWWIVVQAFTVTLTACIRCMGSCTQGCDSWERGRSGGRWDCVCVVVCVCVCRWGFDGGRDGQELGENGFWGQRTCSPQWAHGYECCVMRVYCVTILCPGRLVRKTRGIFMTVEDGVINLDPISRGMWISEVLVTCCNTLLLFCWWQMHLSWTMCTQSITPHMMTNGFLQKAFICFIWSEIFT